VEEEDITKWLDCFDLVLEALEVRLEMTAHVL
jgi:DNA replication protein DnaD